jgi:threonine/homoserine/homoserine lactone efflux protein
VDALVTGYALGLVVAAGFGPISVLALTSGLRYGFGPAFGVGLGAAAVDALYALLAGLGLAALVPGDELQLVGGAALLFIAWKMLHPRGGEAMSLATFERGLGVSFAATLANPSTILSWAAAFAAVVPALHLSRETTLGVLPPAVFLGTLTWFTGLAVASTLAGRRLTPELLRRISVAGGVIVAAFGVVFLVRGFAALG